MNKFCLVFPVLLMSYAPVSDAYTTTTNTVAQAGYYSNDAGVIDTDTSQQINGIAQTQSSAVNQGIEPIYHSPFSYSGSANASAAPGILKASAAAKVITGLLSAKGEATARFDDSFRLVGPTGGNIAVSLSYAISGSISGYAGASGWLSLNNFYTINFSQLYYRANPDFSCSGYASCTGTATYLIPVNTDISLSAFLSVGAGANGDIGVFNAFYKSGAANYGNTAKAFISVGDSRYQLVSNSGYGYSPVPLPASFWLLGSSLLIGWLRLRHTA